MTRAPIVLALCLCSCPLFGDAVDDPCEHDRFQCMDDGFALDPDCELDGTLEVAVGQGMDAYTPLFDDESPVVYDDGPGERYLLLGVRIANPELARYDRVQATFGVYEADRCAPADEPPAPCADPTIGDRVAVPGSYEPLAVQDGAIEEYGMVVAIDGPWEQELVIDVLVEDPCGQRGRAQHRFVGVE